MEIRVGHYPYVIYGPYVTHIKDQTPGILVGIDRRKPVKPDLRVTYTGIKYLVVPDNLTASGIARWAVIASS